jgi:hypothetical protein
LGQRTSYSFLLHSITDGVPSVLPAPGIKIGKNQTTSGWYDSIHLLKKHEILTTRPGMSEEKDDNPQEPGSLNTSAAVPAAIRWLSELARTTSRTWLVPPMLPISGAVLDGKPIFKG